MAEALFGRTDRGSFLRTPVGPVVVVCGHPPPPTAAPLYDLYAPALRPECHLLISSILRLVIPGLIFWAPSFENRNIDSVIKMKNIH